MKANPITEATSNRSLADKGLIVRNYEFMLSILKPIEMIRMIVEITRTPMATGASLNTYFRSFR